MYAYFQQLKKPIGINIRDAILPSYGYCVKIKVRIPILILGLLFMLPDQAFGKLEANRDSFPSPQFQLLLAGGALSTCSSYSKRNCEQVHFPEDVKTEILYEVNEASLTRLEKFVEISAVKSIQIQLSPLLMNLRQYLSNEPLSRTDLFNLFEKADIDTVINRLPDSSYFALLDHLEIAQQNDEGLRLREIANVPATSNPYSREIYQRFTDEVRLRAKAAEQEPQILVITSSSRDPFEVSDFYESAFTSLGVKTKWLPVDQALLHVFSESDYRGRNCENLAFIRQRFELFDRERVYPDRTEVQRQICENPERLADLVAASQGVFFNGGDQSKTLASLFYNSGQPAKFWQDIMAKVERYEMIVGGTSAGTAVHAGRAFVNLPIAMISNGTSEFALKRGVFAALAPSVRCEQDVCANALLADDVTYMPSGGSGLFTLGTLDTHFSERDREGRLIALALETHTQLSAGVDEATALLYGFEDGVANFEVIGEQGVFFVDGTSQAIQKTIDNGARQTQYAGYSHYLFSDTKASLDVSAQVWKMLDGVTLIHERKTLNEANAGIWRNSTRRYCGSREATSWELEGVSYVLAPETATKFFVDAKRKHCGYLYLPFAVGASSELNVTIGKR